MKKVLTVLMLIIASVCYGQTPAQIAANIKSGTSPGFPGNANLTFLFHQWWHKTGAGATAPAPTAIDGTIWIDTVAKKMYVNHGGVWGHPISLSPVNDTVPMGKIMTLYAAEAAIDVIEIDMATKADKATTLTINSVAHDLSGSQVWTVGDVLTSGSYNNPSWITDLGWGKITGTPTTLGGYGISDAYPLSGNPSNFLTSINSSMVIAALGFTPVTNARTITINGTTQSLSADRTWTLTTNDISEGANLYYTAARFNTAFSGKTTTDLAEGTNLYFTNARARSSISLTTTGTSGAATYNSGTGVFNIPNYATSSGTVTSIGVTSTDLSVSGSPVTTSGNITLNLNTSGVSAGTYDWVTVDTKGRVTAGANSPIPTAVASGARNFNQAYQLSSTRPSYVSVSPQVSCNLSLTTGQAGTAILEISANGTTGWIYIGQISGSNTGALTIGLNTTQVTGAPITADLPIGYYWRLRTSNTTGTPTYTFLGGCEIVY